MKVQSLYDRVTQEEFDRLGLRVDLFPYYIDTKSEGKKQLSLEDNKFSFSDKNKLMKDDDCNWRKDLDPVFANIEINIENPSNLFGVGQVASTDSKIGIGITWRLDGSRIKYSRKLCSFENIDVPSRFCVEDIPLGVVGKTLIVDLVLYIAEQGCGDSKNGSIEKKGLVLLNNSLLSIAVSGTGSLFPIDICSKPGKPLWSWSTDIDDVYHDSFDPSSVSIRLNKAHPLYKYIDPDQEETFDKELMAEVLSSAFTMLIMDIRSNYEEKKIDLDNDDCSVGSIHAAMKYLSDTLGIDVNQDNQNALVESIKSFFDQKGGK